MKFLIMTIESMKHIPSIGYKMKTLKEYYIFILTAPESIDALKFNLFGFFKYHFRHKNVWNLYERRRHLF